MPGSADNRSPGLGTVVAFGLVACVLYGVGAGLRGDVGILLNPLAEQTGLAYEDVSLCIAVMQLAFGGTQPLFGILARNALPRVADMQARVSPMPFPRFPASSQAPV